MLPLEKSTSVVFISVLGATVLMLSWFVLHWFTVKPDQTSLMVQPTLSLLVTSPLHNQAASKAHIDPLTGEFSPPAAIKSNQVPFTPSQTLRQKVELQHRVQQQKANDGPSSPIIQYKNAKAIAAPRSTRSRLVASRANNTAPIIFSHEHASEAHQ